MNNFSRLVVVAVLMQLVTWPTLGFRTGGGGSAVEFDGNAGQRIALSFTQPSDWNSFTVAAWVKVAAWANPGAAIVCKGQSSWCLRRCGGTHLLCFETAGLSLPTLISSIPLEVGVWYYVAGVVSGSNKYLYVGTSVASVGALSGSVSVTSQPVLVGENPIADETSTWTGTIDLVSIWKTERTSAQLAADSLVTITANDNLIAGFGFDEQSGNTTTGVGAGTVSGALSATVRRVDSSAPTSGEVMRISTNVGAETVIPLLTDPTAVSVFVTSLPSRGKLYQWSNGTSSTIGVAIAGVPIFVGGDRGRIVYVGDGSGTTDTFLYELRNTGSTTVTSGVVAITIQSNRAPVAGSSAYAVSLNGLDSFIEIDNSNGDFDIDSGTIELWFNANAAAIAGSKRRMALIGIVEGNTPRVGLFIRRDYQAVQVQISETIFEIPLVYVAPNTTLASAASAATANSTASVTSSLFAQLKPFPVSYSAAVSTSSWNHIALVIDSKLNEARVYVNGVLLVPMDIRDRLLDAKPYAPLFAKKVRIGWTGALNPLTFDDDFFAGALDQIRIWNTVSTHNEILASAQFVSTLTAAQIATNNVLAAWSLDEPTGQLCYDTSGHGFTARLAGSGASRILAQLPGDRVMSPPGAAADFRLSGSDPDGNSISAATILSIPDISVGRLFVVTAFGTSNPGSVNGTRHHRQALQEVETAITATPFVINNPVTNNAIVRFKPNKTSTSTGALALVDLSYTVSDGKTTSATSHFIIGLGCTAGYAPGPNSTCVACPAGYYAPTAGMSTCLPCPSGTFSTLSGQSVCLDCDVGSVSNFGEVSCTQCKPGFAVGVRGSSTCIACEPGYWAPGAGFESCQLCPLASFQPNSSSSVCESCPAGSENRYAGKLPAISIDDCECARGFYVPGSNVSRGVACAACPKGASCLGALARPVPASGYFSPDVSAASPLYYLCPNANACPGGTVCRAPYTGFQCAYCEKGYYRLELVCHKCPPGSAGLFVAFWIGFVLLLWLLLQAGRYAKEWGRFSPHAGVATSVGIFIGYWQTISLFFRYQIGWPVWFHRYMSEISFLNFNLESIALPCIPGYNLKPGLERAFPLFLPLIAFGVYGIGWIVGVIYTSFVRKSFGRSFAAKHPNLVKKPVPGHLGSYVKNWIGTGLTTPIAPNITDYANAFFLFLSYSYFWVVEAALNIFHCQHQQDGTVTWIPDPVIQCYTGKIWRPMLAGYMVALIVYGAGIPLLFVMFIRKHRFLHEHDAYVPENQRTKFAAVLWTPYRRQCDYWIVVRLALKKLMVVASIVSFSGLTAPKLPLILTGIFLVAYLVAHYFMQPYRHAWNNHLEMLCTASELLVLIAAFLFHAAKAAGGFEEPSFKDFLHAFLAIVHYSMFFGIVGHFWYFWRSYKHPILIQDETSDILLMCENMRELSRRPQGIEYLMNRSSDDRRRAWLLSTFLKEDAIELINGYPSMSNKQFVGEREEWAASLGQPVREAGHHKDGKEMLPKGDEPASNTSKQQQAPSSAAAKKPEDEKAMKKKAAEEEKERKNKEKQEQKEKEKQAKQDKEKEKKDKKQTSKQQQSGKDAKDSNAPQDLPPLVAAPAPASEPATPAPADEAAPKAE